MDRRSWRGVTLALAILILPMICMIQPASAYHYPPGVDIGQRLVFYSYVKLNDSTPASENYEGYIISSMEDLNGTAWGDPINYTRVIGNKYSLTADEYASNPDGLFHEAALVFSNGVIGNLYPFHHLTQYVFMRADKMVSELGQYYDEMMEGMDYTVTSIEDGRGVLISTLPLESQLYAKYVYTCNGVIESMEVHGFYGHVTRVSLMSGDKWCPDYSFLIIVAVIGGATLGACLVYTLVKRRGVGMAKVQPRS